MQEYRVKISENGRILIPAVLRNQLHFNPGDELIMRVTDNELHLTSMQNAIKNAQALVNKYVPRNQSLINDLILTRKKEIKNEQNRT